MLRRGIHSELFLLAYVKPDTGYRIAQKHQDTTKRPDTSKTSKALNRLEKANYIILKNNKYHPNIEKLSCDLAEYLNSEAIELDETESKFIKDLLTQNPFSTILGQDVLYRMLIQSTKIHHIDALKVISNHIGMICTFYLMPKKNDEKTVTNKTKNKTISKLSKELHVDVQKVNETVKKLIKGSKSVRNKKMNSVNDFGSFMKSFILASTILDKTSIVTLEKLEHLWEQHDGFEIGTMKKNFVNESIDSK